MGKPTGFLEFNRKDCTYLPVKERITHFNEFIIPLNEDNLTIQSSRCMDCGIPFCHTGCPINNIIPDWNDLVYRGEWRDAVDSLHTTNNFPEFTGRICPAPCQEACTLNISNQPVTIKTIECAIIEKGWERGWIKPKIANHRSGKNVAIVGSGPAGMTAAQQLARAGHNVIVYEKESHIGGLLRFGIPDFKLNKKIIDRRISQILAEGVKFRTNVHVGIDILASDLVSQFDAVILATGSEKPRDLIVPGRNLNGIYFAMDFLKANTKYVQHIHSKENIISTKDKHVIVIGGGDTGSDCIGTANRQGATSITQLEILPMPPDTVNKGTTWPNWPNKMRTSTSQEEGCKRIWSVKTKEFISNKNGDLKALKYIKIKWEKRSKSGDWCISEDDSKLEELKADIVTLAMGFSHPVHEGMLNELNIKLDNKGNIDSEKRSSYRTSIDKVFAAGDVRRGQSLVVWAIQEGRQCATAVDEYLK